MLNGKRPFYRSLRRPFDRLGCTRDGNASQPRSRGVRYSSAAAAARAILTEERGWTISDDGLAPDVPSAPEMPPRRPAAAHGGRSSSLSAEHELHRQAEYAKCRAEHSKTIVGTRFQRNLSLAFGCEQSRCQAVPRPKPIAINGNRKKTNRFWKTKLTRAMSTDPMGPRRCCSPPFLRSVHATILQLRRAGCGTRCARRAHSTGHRIELAFANWARPQHDTSLSEVAGRHIALVPLAIDDLQIVLPVHIVFTQLPLP